MTARPKVSGSIVLYKNYKKIRETIGSVLGQTEGVDFTLYIIDNASGDGSLEKLKAEFPSIVAIQNPKNKGFGYGHNAALPLLDSDFHAVINPDITLDSDAITQLCEYLEANPGVGLVTPKIRFPDGSDQLLPKRDPTFLALFGRHLFKEKLRPVVEHYQMLDEDLTKPIDIEFATGCFFVIRTELYKKLGGFDERFFMYFEDMDITRRARKYARAVYYPYASVIHAWERASSHKPRFFAILVISMFKYFGKWGFKLK